MTVVRGLVLALGIVVLVMNAASTIRILIVPRAATGVATMPMRSVRVAFRRLAQLARSYVAKDRILALSEPARSRPEFGPWPHRNEPVGPAAGMPPSPTASASWPPRW